MEYAIYISEEERAELVKLLALIGKLVYSANQSKAEEAMYRRLNNLIKNEKSGVVLKSDIKEIPNDMPQIAKTFKKTIKIEGRDVHIRTRVCGKKLSYELRYRKGGLNVNASALDKNAAIIKFSEKLKEALSAGTAPKVPATFHEFSMYYFEKFRKRKVTSETYRRDLSRYNNHIKPHFGATPLKKVTPEQCQTLLDNVVAAGHERNAQDIYSLLNVIFKTAIAHGIIERNPLAIVLSVEHEREHGKALAKSEEKYLLEVTAGSPYQLMFAVALYTGLRPNEYKTARIDGEFIVAVNSKRKSKKVEYKKIPISPMLRPYVQNVDELHFYRLETMREKFRSILPGHKLYDMRTTFYTRCHECGVADVARMEFVGHSLGKLGNAYTDLSDDFLLKEGNKLDY